jgi:acyl carrier protein
LSLQSLVEFVAGRVAERIGVEAASDHDGDLFELGLDSVDAVELTGEIEERFGLEIDPGLPFEERSINRLAAALAGASAQRPV